MRKRSSEALANIERPRTGWVRFVVVGLLGMVMGWLLVYGWPRFGKDAVQPAAGPSPSINSNAPPGAAPDGMVWIPGGTYWRGSNTPSHRDSLPWHMVAVDGFWMDITPVTNEQFAKFVAETKYATIAERSPKAEDFPGAPPENLVAGSIVFSPPDHSVPLNNHFEWWGYVHGANWHHPDGPKSDLKGREHH